jgi:phage shock protein C
MFCTKCGVQLEERDCFCFECGTPTGRAPAVVRQKRLVRSITNSKIAGVCGGLAEYLEADPTVVRLLCVVFSLAIPPAGLLGYIIAWIVVPKEQYPLTVSNATVPQT